MKNIEKYKDTILNSSLTSITCCANSLSYVEDCTKKKLCRMQKKCYEVASRRI